MTLPKALPADVTAQGESGPTPGPWTVDKYLSVIGPDGFSVAECNILSLRKGAPTEARRKANADLIASIPTMQSDLTRLREVNAAMLAALKAADALMSFDGGNPKDETGWQHDELREAWVVVTDAVAKAEVS